MKDETKKKLETEIADWAYMKELPEVWLGFHLNREMNSYGDVYDLYSYEKPGAPP